MCKNSHNTSDERYRRIEAKIQNTVDTILISGTVITKVTEFCVLAEINPATFYSHYKSVGEVFSARDVQETKKFHEHFADDRQQPEIVFRKVFYYINKHRPYFKSASVRNNIYPYRNIATLIQPALTKKWAGYRVWDENRDAGFERIYYKLTFEIAGEYCEWIELEDFSSEKINGHVKHLVYLIDTACQRHGSRL